jgi:hypothetical protein
MATAEAVLWPARQMSGTVRDPQGKPIANAMVECADSESKATSDANGKFTLQAVPDYSLDPKYGQVVWLDISHPDFVSTKADVAGSVQEITISMTPGVAIEGTVRDRESGKGVANFSITGSSAGARAQMTRTDAEGKYRLRLPAGQIALNVRRPWMKDPLANNYIAVKKDQTVFVAEGESKSGVDILVTKGHVIRGHVVDAITKKPVEGLNMRIAADGARDRMSQSIGRHGGETDADGQFIVSGVASGKYSITSLAIDESVKTEKVSVDVADDADPKPIELTAIRRLTDSDLPQTEPLVTGKIVNPDGRPAPMAVVEAYLDAPNPDEDMETCRSSPDGTFGFNFARYHISGPGEFRAYDVGKEFVGVVEVRDVAAPPQPFVVTLGKGATFSGTVRDDKGQPVPGISVMVSRMVWMGNTSAQYAMCRGITDSAGKYTTSPFVPSSKDTAAALECQAMRDGHSWAIKPEGKYSSLNVTPGAHTDGLDFTLVIEGHEAYFAAKPAQGK